jgi:hypothetical protein
MRLEQKSFDRSSGWRHRSGGLGELKPQLILLFGGRHLLVSGEGLEEIRQFYPGARIVAASTSGEITGTEVSEDNMTSVAIALEKSRVACEAVTVSGPRESYSAGQDLARRLVGPDLAHVFAISDGTLVNGAELARGFNETLPGGVRLTGGLAGDGNRFEETVVGLDEKPVPGRIVAVAFYGRRLRVAFGTSGGWEPFGPERAVTRAEGNVLHELDGKSALGLYKSYLGEHAAELPGSALRFPLSVTVGSSSPVVRTIVSIDEKAESMTFAGDIPLGSRVRFMRASYEDLIDGATRAAELSGTLASPQMAICVSCVGRRIVLGQRTEEETEAVQERLGSGAILTGFYSYGELAPADSLGACQLHNQTMTITAISEEV